MHSHKPLAVLGTLAFTLMTAPIAVAQDAVSVSTPPSPAQCGIPGHHALLEKMTEAFVLTCEQELKLEPLLHDEESVSKPLLRFVPFTPDEKKAVMQEVKVAARRQIRPLLTPAQQKTMDAEIDTVSKGGDGMRSEGSKGGGGAKTKKEEPAVEPFLAEESLSDAIAKYAALSDAEKKDLIIKVKKAARRPDAPELTPEQAKRIDEEIKKMSS